MNTSLITVFLTGLLTGGLTCLAVQGGLLASSIAASAKGGRDTKKAVPILVFLIAKLTAYTVLGFLLGWIGARAQLSLSVRLIMQFAVVVFMLGTAGNLLKLHPIFRYFVIQPPKFLARLVWKQSKVGEWFGPAILGAFTVFVPCGTTQAMMALAISTASPVLGALTMGIFVLGTSPLFFGLGYAASKLSGSMQEKFSKFAAGLLIVLALYNLDGAIALTGSKHTLANYLKVAKCSATNSCDSRVLSAKTGEGATEATISIVSGGYSPRNISLKAGSKVKLNLVNKSGTGCEQAFTIPSVRLQTIVPIGSSETVEFETPDKPGQIAFMCSMGMYRGTITII